jgi:hypothetical protein
MELSFPAQAACSHCRADACRNVCLQRCSRLLCDTSCPAFCWQADAACCRYCHPSQAIHGKRRAPANMLQASRQAERQEVRMSPCCWRCSTRERQAGGRAGQAVGRADRRADRPASTRRAKSLPSTYMGHERGEDKARHCAYAIRAVHGAGVAAAAGGREPAGCSSTRGSAGERTRVLAPSSLALLTRSAACSEVSKQVNQLLQVGQRTHRHLPAFIVQPAALPTCKRRHCWHDAALGKADCRSRHQECQEWVAAARHTAAYSGWVGGWVGGRWSPGTPAAVPVDNHGSRHINCGRLPL